MKKKLGVLTTAMTTSLTGLLMSANAQVVEFGVIPVPIPQFGVVPPTSAQAQAQADRARQQANARHYGNFNQRPAYNGYSYQWSQPGYQHPPSYPYYRPPAYSGPLYPTPHGTPPWITVIPMGGYGVPAPGYPPVVCSICHHSPCAGHHQSTPYPAYPGGYYPGGYYPGGHYYGGQTYPSDGYYSRDTRTSNGGISIGNDNVRVNIGGSRTTTESTTSTTIYGR